MNGQIIKQDEVRISPFDHGFLYGLGVFETFRLYNGHPFLLDDHLERLNKSLETLMIERAFTRDEIMEIVISLSNANELKDAYIRLNVSAGNGEIGLQTDVYKKPNVIMFQKPLQPPKEMQEKEGVWLETKRNTPELSERLKSHHYLNNIAAKREIGNDLRKEGIFFTSEGFIAEGIVSNVFWIKGGTLYTPTIETGILNGVTRQLVMALAKKNGWRMEEGYYKKEQLLEAEEAFFTNSIQEIVPIVCINSRVFPGRKGKHAKNLYEDYSLHREELWSRNQL
ncbi:4-amino-4-deoxychorismate lyase [Bacillus ectoiniformans]|nr:4-amino-4-deoxychorismate lyase [Bacillus ectoiniformans]